MESVILDIRYAFRAIRRSPLFAAGVAGTIGLGLGVVCSAFTIVNAYLLRPIDLPNPYEIHELSWDSATGRRLRFRLSDVEALHERNEPDGGVWRDLVAGAIVFARLDDVGTSGQAVTPNYFQALGVRAEVGRTFVSEDGARPGQRPVVVLTHNLWTSHYAGDPSIVGREIRIGAQQYTVVGIAQRGFAGFGEPASLGFWVPLTMARDFQIPDPWAMPAAHSLFVMGRLRESVSVEQARAWLDVWLRQRFPAGDASAPVAVRVESRATRVPMTAGTITAFSLLVSAFGLVLLVASANVANMMLARGLARQREIAVRLSMGAGGWRVIRQLITESLVLAVPAAGVGLALTWAVARVFPVLVTQTMPPDAPFKELIVPYDPDARVFLFLVALSTIAAVVVGLSPAFQVSRVNLVLAARGEPGVGIRASRLRNGLVVMQIAACALFLVIALGLLDQARRASNVSTGLDQDRVLDLRVAAPLRAATAERLKTHGAVEQVGVSWRPPFYGPLERLRMAPGGGLEHTIGFIVVSPEYFEVFGVDLRRGRVFTDAEARDNAPVVVVSEATAHRFWPGVDPIGQTLDVRSPANARTRPPSQTRVQVIGVAEDVTSGNLLEGGADATCVYFPTWVGAEGAEAILIRARGDVSTVRTAAAAAVGAVKPDAPFQLFEMRQVLAFQFWILNALSAAAWLLGAIGLVLACSGTYGVVSYLATQRTREIGIRMALGATAGTIVGGMIREALWLGAVGTLTGGLLAAAESLLLGGLPIAPPLAPLPYALGAAAVILATLVAAYIPSARAARVDPSEALRAE